MNASCPPLYCGWIVSHSVADAVLEQVRLGLLHVRRHLLQRRDVVHDPEAAAVRGRDEVALARMHLQVVHGDRRQVVVQPAPASARR